MLLVLAAVLLVSPSRSHHGLRLLRLHHPIPPTHPVHRRVALHLGE
jgi:hypothetical protein